MWCLFARIVRFLTAAATVAALGACAQAPDKVGVGVGTSPYLFKDARPYAYLFRPYAEMSALAYSDPQFQDARLCPSRRGYTDPANVTADHTAADNDAAEHWLMHLKGSGWRCVQGHVGAYCRAGEDCVGGLQFHVWRNGCDAVLAFRGTDPHETGPLLTRGDLVSNLRWFINLPVNDEYVQARWVAIDLARAAAGWGCGRRLRLMTTGHSLGGGLAQQAAFADPTFSYVYAFDPSPVTGLFDINWDQRQRSLEKLGIDRVYESGEILSLPRYLVSGVFATSPCQPRIRIVRFATIAAPSLLDRHRITNLTRGLIEQAAPARPAPKLPTGYANAVACDFTGNDPEMRAR